MNITDEIAEAFDFAYDACACPAPRTRYCCIRAGIEAVAPLIAAQAALAERVKIVADVRMHAERTARTVGLTPAAATALSAIEHEVADRINVLPDEDEERKCPACGHAKRWHLNDRCAGDLLCCVCTDTP